MGIIQFITRGFIDFFGITKPEIGEQRRAGWFIFGMLAAVLVLAAAVFGIVVLFFGH